MSAVAVASADGVAPAGGVVPTSPTWSTGLDISFVASTSTTNHQQQLEKQEREKVCHTVQALERVLIPLHGNCSTAAHHNRAGPVLKFRHINWSMVTCKIAAPVTGTILRTTDPVPADSRQ